GTLERLRLPAGVRVDSGVREGDAVTPYYDPMIAKVIAHDGSRKSAAAKLAGALKQTQVAGLRTNNAFLIRALQAPDFLAGEIDTGFIERHLDALLPAREPDDDVLAAATQFLAQEHKRSADPWDARDGFRLGGVSRQAIEFVIADERVAVPIAAGAPEGIDVMRLQNGDLAAMRDGETFVLKLYDPMESAGSHGVASDRIATPMPGKIVQILVKEGERVKKGQPLAVLEAMKMEHTLAAPAEATVEAVQVVAGDQVAEGTVVVRFAKEAA
ncbi:MAG: biotin/lipoyl-binding protein, partial [Alphaproteobacteria bacterium]|nr:biotin/lipoyl-binding protein [Alphaproteobacteria bacterium]